MTSSTGQQIREELVKYGVILLLGTTVGTSAASYLSDTARIGSQAISSTAFEDCWVRITSGTLTDEISKVDYIDTDNGRIYVDPVWSGTPAASVTYEVYRAGVLPDDIDRARDEALTRICSQWALQPISELTNADYEDALGSTWAGSSATPTFVTDIDFPDTIIGRNAQRVTLSGASGYSQSTSLYVRPGRSFYLYVPVSARVGTAVISIRDVTNSDTITPSGTLTSSGRGWTAFELTGQVPSTCYEMAIRLGGTGATDIIDYGPVQLHWQNQRRIALPDRIDSRKKIGRIYYYDFYPIVGRGDDYGIQDKQEVPNVGREMVNDTVVLQFSPESPLSNQPYWYQERIYYDALSTDYQTVAQRGVGDAATTLCPLDYAAAATVRILSEWYAMRNTMDIDYWGRLHSLAQEWLKIWEREHGPPPAPIATRERTVSIPYRKV